MKDASSRDNKSPANKPASQNSVKTKSPDHFGLNKLAIILAAFSVLAAILISFFSYQKSIRDTLGQYYVFYAQIAELIAVDIEAHPDMTDNEIINYVKSKWERIENRPSDEHLYIVNKDHKVLLHTNVPSSVGNIVEHDMLLDKYGKKYPSFGDIVKGQKWHFGGAVSSSGDNLMVSFVPVPKKNWIVSVHRSKEVLLREINFGLKAVLFSLSGICGILIPVSFVILFWTFIISENKRRATERSLIKSQQRYREIVYGTDDLITQVDVNGNFMFVNHMSDKIWGISSEECVGLPAFDLIHPDDRESTKKAFEGWVSKKMEQATCVNRQVNKNGQIFEMLWTINLEFNDAGEVESVLSVAHDVTEQKKMEQERMDLNKNLERLVKERTMELKAVNEELEAFNYSVSHDLRAPIRSMQGFTKALMEKNKDILDVESLDYLKRVRNGSLRMREMVDSLLRLSRVSRKNIVKSKVGISRLAANVIEDMKARDPEHDIEIVIEDGLAVSADKALLKIVVENLIDNAWKFSARSDNPKIEFGATKPDDEIVFFVRDNGCGFDMEYCDKLFVPFQRLHKYEDYEGLGMGLATVKRIIHLHGGRIWAESETGKGTTFYFVLPG